MMNRARFPAEAECVLHHVGRGKTWLAWSRPRKNRRAGLDVYEAEPLPAEHPLWTMPGVLMTPHTAGYGPYLDERRYAIILENCRAFLAGQPLRNVVDKANWF